MEVGKLILVVFEDGEKVNRKEGIFISKDTEFLRLRIGTTVHLIPIKRIVRMEASE